jgi:hypothetical protein
MNAVIPCFVLFWFRVGFKQYYVFMQWIIVGSSYECVTRVKFVYYCFKILIPPKCLSF